MERIQIRETLGQFAGNWRGENTATLADGRIFKGTASVKITQIADGLALHFKVNVEDSEKGAFEEQNLLSYDPQTQRWHKYSVNSKGEVHDHIGDLVDARTIKLTWQGIMEGQQSSEDLTVALRSPEEYYANCICTIGGQIGPIYESVFKRQL